MRMFRKKEDMRWRMVFLGNDSCKHYMSCSPKSEFILVRFPKPQFCLLVFFSARVVEESHGSWLVLLRGVAHVWARRKHFSLSLQLWPFVVLSCHDNRSM